MSESKQITKVGNGLKILAPAKINLSLLIAGKRADGFHEIETLMAKINYFDELLIEPGKKDGIELICRGPEWSPQGEENLVYKACDLLLKKHSKQANIKVTLTKNIPAGSGLGSASSDAAATLIGLNKFLQMRLNIEELSELAAQLGSDVAFFLHGPLAFCTGRGEKIKEIKEKFNFSAILVLPDINVSTARVYEKYEHDENKFRYLSTQINEYIGKNRIDLAVKMCANMLEISCFDVYRELVELKTMIESLGIQPLRISGSGAAMFYIIDNSQGSESEDYSKKLKDKIDCKNIIVTNNRW